MSQAQQSKTVTGRTVQKVGDGSLRSTIPAEIVQRYGIEKGDTIVWDDDGSGTVTVRVPNGE